jgi:hypothetical protein
VNPNEESDMATVRVTYYGMDGAGRTVTEAKQDAGRQIERALEGSYEPTILASRGMAIMVWRDPYGWRASFITDGGDDKGNGGFRDRLSYSTGKDRKAALEEAMMSLAQLTWDGSELLSPCLGDAESLAKRRDVDGRAMLAEFRSWRGFQLAYKAARAQGVPECDCHRWACENSSKFAA